MGVAQNTSQQYSQNNQGKSLLGEILEYIKDHAIDLTGSMNAFFNSVADRGYETYLKNCVINPKIFQVQI
ncbi:MAG: hypothetical protein DSY47_07955 [Hydrogenothermus sp.]|nr:MAG: hypothetical protein DSY47_07955 [Hydrogenothermus sp.]